MDEHNIIWPLKCDHVTNSAYIRKRNHLKKGSGKDFKKHTPHTHTLSKNVLLNIGGFNYVPKYSFYEHDDSPGMIFDHRIHKRLGFMRALCEP